jgi:eukaryotic-like serine/threonine-protein kinase
MGAEAQLRQLLPSITKYELLEEIGHGGMATVYRARDPRIRREVALKVLHRHLLDSEEVSHRFRAEAQAVAKLRHPNILEVYDVSGEDDREKYLVVELVHGKSLRQVLKDRGALPPEVAMALVCPLLDALHHAHKQGVIHRDIKPENIMIEERVRAQDGSDDARETPASLTPLPAQSQPQIGALPSSRDVLASAPPSGSTATPIAAKSNSAPHSARCITDEGAASKLSVVLKVMDFGIAKVLDAQGVTSTGQVLGSPAHMAPEQIEGADVDARADIFAVGIVLYELFCGALPFRGTNPAQVLRRVLDGHATPVDQINPKVGSRLAAIVAKALAREKEGRYPSARAFREALEAELVYAQMPPAAALLSDYFAKPEPEFTEPFEERLKSVLCTQGKAALAREDAIGAASAYNRALAYAPCDMVLLKAVGAMRKAHERKRKLRRALPYALALVAITACAFAVTRLYRNRTRDAALAVQRESEMRTAAAMASSSAHALEVAKLAATAVSAAPLLDAGFDAQMRVAPSSTSATAATAAIGTAAAAASSKEAKRNVIIGRIQPISGVLVALDDGAAQPASEGMRIAVDGNPHELRFTCASDLCEAQSRSVGEGARDVELGVEMRLKPATLLVDGELERHYQIDKFPEVIVRASVPARVPVRRGDETVTVTELETGEHKSVLLPPGRTANVSFRGH